MILSGKVLSAIATMRYKAIMSSTSERLLTIAQVADVLGIRYQRAADLVRRSLIPAVWIGRQVRVSPNALKAFIEGGGYQLEGGWRRDRQDVARS